MKSEFELITFIPVCCASATMTAPPEQPMPVDDETLVTIVIKTV